MKHLTILLTGVALLSACRKEDTVVVPNPTVVDEPVTSSALADFSRRNAPAQQVSMIEARQNNTWTLAGGALLKLNGHAFDYDQDGRIVQRVTDSVELRTRALYTAADFVLANQPTNDSTGTRLVSGGLVQIQFQQRGQRLSMFYRSGVQLTVPAPTTQNTGAVVGTPSAMSLWNLQLARNQRLWRNTQQNVWWSASATPPAYVSSFGTDTISWWHFSRPWNEQPAAARTTVRVACAINPDVPTATQVWLLPTGVNAAFRAQPSRTAFGGETTQELSDIPVGTALTIVVLQSRGNELYYSNQAITVTANHLVSMAPVKLPEAEIVRRIRQL